MSKTETPRYVRRNITVPVELDRNMRSAGEVNWSRIAARAFEAFVKRMTHSKRGNHAPD